MSSEERGLYKKILLTRKNQQYPHFDYEKV